MSKRPNGEGSLWFDEAKQLHRAAITTPAGKRLTKSSKDESIVKDWLNEQRLLIGRGQHVEPHGLTLKTWLDEWLEVYAKPNVRPRTHDRYCSLLAHFNSIGSSKLVSLTPSTIQKQYNALTDLSASTKRHIHFCLHGALQQAVINNLLHTNPADKIKPPSAPKTEIEIFTDDEVKSLLETAEKYRYPVVITLAYTTGMRLSEILALRWQDIDIKKSTVSVNQTVHKSLSGVYFSEPKTKTSKRKITVPPDTVQAITEHKFKYGIQEGLLFTTKVGTPLHPTHYLRYTFDPIRDAAGIKKNFHAFRHTHASILLSAGVPIQDVSRRLGHSKVSTTLDVYSHCLPSADEKIAEKLSAITVKRKQG